MRVPFWLGDFFPINTHSKIPKTYLPGPTSVQSSSIKWHPSRGNLSKISFSNLNLDFIGKFSDLQLSLKFVKNYVMRPLSVRSFSKIQRETFEVEIFPIFSTSKKKNCKTARIGKFCKGNFFPKNRKFFHFFH